MLLPIENHPADSRVKLSEDGIVQTLSARMGTGGGNVPLLLFDLQAFGQYGTGGVSSTLQERDYKYVSDIVCDNQYVCRRWTPLECSRLQGMPDDWLVDGSDAAKYRAMGNAIALPCAYDVLKRIAMEEI